MKGYAFYSFLIIALLGALFVAGCSKTSTEPDSALDPIDQEYGGFTTSDEAVDDYIIDDFATEDEDADDGISDDPSVTALLDSNALDVYFVRVTWGMLDWDSSATVVMNWNGNASINKGTLVIVKKIGFEAGSDYIVRPRPDRQHVEWVSETLYHHDGLYFAIIDNDTALANTEGEFTINVGPYSNTFTFSQLDSMDLLESVDELGNQVAIVAYKRYVVPFAGGFLDGRWVRENEKGGRFWGRWIHSTGLHAGYLKGIWGMNQYGKRVFFGKYLSINGQFKGLLKGNYEPIDTTTEDGWFKGVWVNKNLNAAGTLAGKYKVGPAGARKGFFKGRWKEKL